MSDRRHPHVVNVDELDAVTTSVGTKFGASRKALATAAGGRALGCSWYEVAPGRSGFPFHYHFMNDESVFVLDGEGTLRIGDATVPVRAGDYLTFPAGPGTAHRLDNTGTTPLRYLCISTMHPAELCGYPDSNKFGCFGSVSVDAAQRRDRALLEVGYIGSSVGYYEGEDIG